jgi:hypothetical protein
MGAERAFSLPEDLFETFGTQARQEKFIPGGSGRTRITAFGLAKPTPG